MSSFRILNIRGLFERKKKRSRFVSLYSVCIWDRKVYKVFFSSCSTICVICTLWTDTLCALTTYKSAQNKLVVWKQKQEYTSLLYCFYVFSSSSTVHLYSVVLTNTSPEEMARTFNVNVIKRDLIIIILKVCIRVEKFWCWKFTELIASGSCVIEDSRNNIRKSS